MGLSVKIPHALGLENAIQKMKIKDLVPKLMEANGSKASNVWEEWHGPSAAFGFETQGQKITGTVHVSDRSVTIDCRLPFLASFFSSEIEDAIRSEAAKLLT